MIAGAATPEARRYRVGYFGKRRLGSVYLCYLVWAMATGRIGVIHWAPTARRQGRLGARAAAEQARLEQQRLDAALSYGSYRPTAGRAEDRDAGGM